MFIELASTILFEKMCIFRVFAHGNFPIYPAGGLVGNLGHDS